MEETIQMKVSPTLLDQKKSIILLSLVCQRRRGSFTRPTQPVTAAVQAVPVGVGRWSRLTRPDAAVAYHQYHVLCCPSVASERWQHADCTAQRSWPCLRWGPTDQCSSAVPLAVKPRKSLYCIVGFHQGVHCSVHIDIHNWVAH